MKIPAEYQVIINRAQTDTLRGAALDLCECGTCVNALSAAIEDCFGLSSSPMTAAMIYSIHSAIHVELYARGVRSTCHLCSKLPVI